MKYKIVIFNFMKFNLKFIIIKFLKIMKKFLNKFTKYLVIITENIQYKWEIIMINELIFIV